jgi:hypothetical protein
VYENTTKCSTHPSQFVGLHEGDVQCTPRRRLGPFAVLTDFRTPDLTGIGEEDWAFKTSFEAGDQELSAPNVELVFEGLDTFSVITLVSRT